MVDLVNIVRKTLATAIVLGGFAFGFNRGQQYSADFKKDMAKDLAAGNGLFHGKSEFSRWKIREMQDYLRNWESMA